MSDRALWLEDWCPTCRAAPGARYRLRWGNRARAKPSALHIARGWRARPCPKCKAIPGESCLTPSGREASRIHEGRLGPCRYELLARDAVWAELERRSATVATVPFSGRAGCGGKTERIVLSRVQGNRLVDVERWSGRDELCYALKAPIWDRFGLFAGQPLTVGTVIWSAADRRVVIEGQRCDKHLEELV